MFEAKPWELLIHIKTRRGGKGAKMSTDSTQVLLSGLGTKCFPSLPAAKTCLKISKCVWSTGAKLPDLLRNNDCNIQHCHQ